MIVRSASRLSEKERKAYVTFSIMRIDATLHPQKFKSATIKSAEPSWDETFVLYALDLLLYETATTQ